MGVLTKVGTSYQDFPEGTKWSQRIRIYDEAVEVLNKATEAPLVAFGYWSRVEVYSRFGGGCRARVALEDEKGNVSLSDWKVSSVEEAEKIAKEKDLKLAGTNMLLNTAFIEKYAGVVVVFSSRNASALNAGEFQDAYYLVSAARDALSSKAGGLTSAIDAELKKVQSRRAEIKEEDEKLAKREKELQELRPKAEKAEKDEVQAKELLKGAADSKETVLEELQRSA